MTRSLKAGRRVRLDQVGLFADGVAVKQVGKETFRLCRKLVDEMVLVDTDAMCAAIKDVFEDTRVVLEPAGALAIAGAKAWVERRGARGKTLVAVASGANMNFDRLRFIAEEAELGEQREAILAVTIPERPGSFKRFCATLGGAQHHRVQLPHRRRERRAHLRRRGGARPRRDRSASSATCAATASSRSTSRTTRWRSGTCATWSAGAPEPQASVKCETRCCIASSFRSGRAR